MKNIKYKYYAAGLTFFLVFAFIFSPSILLAQKLPGNVSANESEKKPDANQNYYVGIILKIPHLVDNWGYEIGARVGFKFNSLGLGLGYYALVSRNIQLNDKTFFNQPGSLLLTYGGLEVDYSIKPIEFFRISLVVLVGIGSFSYAGDINYGITEATPSKVAFILEPGICLNFEILSGLWITTGAHYRYTGISEFIGLNSSKLSGPVFSIGVGSF